MLNTERARGPEVLDVAAADAAQQAGIVRPHALFIRQHDRREHGPAVNEGSPEQDMDTVRAKKYGAVFRNARRRSETLFEPFG